MAPLITVLCVDDHPLMRDGIAFTLQQQDDMRLVGEATNGKEAIDAYKWYNPDVTLMDLQMPVMSGMAAMAAILEEFPQACMVALTTYSGDVQASRALRIGARGYLLKSSLRTDLISTIRQVHAGYRCVPPHIAQSIAANVAIEELTDRELEVLRCVAAGKSNKAVGDILGITEDTVKGHMRGVLAKLQASDRTHAVMIAMRRGYFEV